jgi:hypothetical protein
VSGPPAVACSHQHAKLIGRTFSRYRRYPGAFGAFISLAIPCNGASRRFGRPTRHAPSNLPPQNLGLRWVVRAFLGARANQDQSRVCFGAGTRPDPRPLRACHFNESRNSVPAAHKNLKKEALGNRQVREPSTGLPKMDCSVHTIPFQQENQESVRRSQDPARIPGSQNPSAAMLGIIADSC